ncbi:triosephosphate isomerase [Denitrovibrio acetiphilus DSM 12809]|jgi:triosephosphate isomerase|uniref:Triosephosphate isomerase n=1 Tax=Denitrovibrio acetiphilus (strain DSM 12809 / NBRC 114555 / N2460) TaxID=522772 RepID=D4H724_DENA2|nr:triose-phosphate isomerase [Denitrovibrio acetiphilus]ADD69728.1 triosephosphate isomerase [Denitrovibrio acetiphilus DSM 12809]
MRKPYIYGNWKMNLDMHGSSDLISSILSVKIDYTKVDVGVAPDFSSLYKVSQTIKQMGYPISVAAQNISAEEKGAFTGDVSAAMVFAAGADSTILGHSERRMIFAEGDELINQKVKTALRNNLDVILCVGETLDERESGVAADRVVYQVGMGLKDIGMDRINRVTLAYEPVWAIGTGKTATPADAEDIHGKIRTQLSKMYGPVVAEKIRILYGGSVKPDNVSALMMRENIDGALVGGASLDATSFAKLVNFNG